MSEWQVEKTPFGGTRRYRMTPFGKEYEKIINTAKYGEVSESQLEILNKREAMKDKTPKKVEIQKPAYCPLSGIGSGRRPQCRKDCAFWSESGCMESSETWGKKCPLTLYKCDDTCKLYNDECTLIAKVR